MAAVYDAPTFNVEHCFRICFVMLHYAHDVEPADIHGYLDRTPIHWALPHEMADRGHQVHLIHLWPRDASFVEHGVRFQFVAESQRSRAVSNGLGYLRRGDAAQYQPAWRAIRRIRSLHSDVIHFHGSTLNLNLLLLFRALGSSVPPVILHYHGGYPSHNRLARRLQRDNFARTSRFCFSTLDHAQPFIEAGVLNRSERIIELMETSSTFQPRSRPAARQLTGMTGDPVFLSVGRLHPIKEPLTTLRGFERVLDTWHDAELYLYYTSTELLPDVVDYLSQRPSLHDHVHLRGRASFDEMEAIYNSADVLLQASLREFSGCAVLEAMACGVVPVVTAIPSFRAMTGDGRFGALFPIGDYEALAGQILRLPRGSFAELSTAVRAYFEQSLSFGHMAGKLESIYCNALAEEQRSLRVGMAAS